MPQVKKISTNKKVSIIEHEIQIISDIKQKEYWKNAPVKDKYFIVQLLFLFLGLMHFLPYTFFLTANAYWMYKFRDISSNSTDVSTRTYYQTHFASATQIANTIPFTLCFLLSTLYGFKISPKKRVLSSLIIITTCFLVATAFIKINTDTWQGPFFFATLFTLVIINGTNAVLETATFAIIARFPPQYMSHYLFGEGCAGVLNATLQILSLMIDTSVVMSAMIYFFIGSFSLMFTLVLFYFTYRFNSFYKYFADKSPMEQRRKTISYSEFKDIFKNIWQIIIALMIYLLTTTPINTPITSLVVSENYGSGSVWSDVYFVPVITFLYSHICTLIGRVVGSKVNLVIKGPSAITVMLVRMIILVPLLIFCNAQPRKHLPVLLPHDWEYIISLGALTFTDGFLFNLSFLSISTLLPAEQVEDGYIILVASLSTMGTLFTPIVLFSVDIL